MMHIKCKLKFCSFWFLGFCCYQENRQYVKYFSMTTAEAGAIVWLQRVELYFVYCIARCCGFVSATRTLKQVTWSYFASSVDKDVSGGPVGRNWLRQWFQTSNLSFTFLRKSMISKCMNEWMHARTRSLLRHTTSNSLGQLLCFCHSCLFISSVSIVGLRKAAVSHHEKRHLTGKLQCACRRMNWCDLMANSSCWRLI